MGVLSYQTAVATVQDALINVIRLALQRRLTQATLVTLAAIPSRGSGGTGNAILDGTHCYVTAQGKAYRWSQYSTTPGDGLNVIVPSDAAGGPGRWLITSSTILDPNGVALSSVPTGYLKRVMLWAGQDRNEEVWKTRVLGQRPCVILAYAGESKEVKANQRGALKLSLFRFVLMAVSQNLRPDLEGEKGSPISTEATTDPGVARIMGDLEYLLDGLRGVDMGVDGLDFLMLEAAQPAIEDYDGREFLWTIDLTARCTVGKEDPPTRQPLSQAFLQAQDTQLHQQPTFDPENYVVSGLVIGTGPGFVAAPTDGSAEIGGVLVTVAGAPPHTFTPSVATWRDLKPDGTFTYPESSSPDFPPAVTTGALRVAVTITDPSGIVEDRPIAATSMPVGPNNQILP